MDFFLMSFIGAFLLGPALLLAAVLARPDDDPSS